MSAAPPVAHSAPHAGRTAPIAALLGEANRVEWDAAMLFAAGDHAALRSYLEAQLSQEGADAWRLMSDAALELARERFSARAIAARWAEVYAPAVRGSGAA